MSDHNLVSSEDSDQDVLVSKVNQLHVKPSLESVSSDSSSESASFASTKSTVAFHASSVTVNETENDNETTPVEQPPLDSQIVHATMQQQPSGFSHVPDKNPEFTEKDVNRSSTGSSSFSVVSAQANEVVNVDEDDDANDVNPANNIDTNNAKKDQNHINNANSDAAIVSSNGHNGHGHDNGNGHGNGSYRPADGYARDEPLPSDINYQNHKNFSRTPAVSPPRPAMTIDSGSGHNYSHERVSPSHSVTSLSNQDLTTAAVPVTAPPSAITASTSNPNLSTMASGSSRSRMSPSHSYHGLQPGLGMRNSPSPSMLAADASGLNRTGSPTPGATLPRPASAGAIGMMGGNAKLLGHRQRDSRFNLRPVSSRSSFMSGSNDDSPVFNTATPPFVASHSRRTSMASFSLNETANQYASASMFDLSQSYLTPHFGEDAKSSLMPRIKTIEQYRKNARKSNDPVIQFQFAQYMLQTALLSGTMATPNNNNRGDQESNSDSGSGGGSSVTAASPAANGSSSKGRPTSIYNRTNKKSLGDRLPGADNISEEEKRIKADLLKEAITNLRKLSDKGFPEAQYLLGDAYASGALGKPDLKESFALFQLAAKHGHGEASYRAALCLEEGWGCSKDIKRAVQFLRTASSRNQPGAMLRLGLACFYGKMGLPNNSKVKQEGIKWLQRAADAANEIYPQGPYELAKIYEVGYKDIVFIDYQYSVQLYVRSAELHYIPAATKLGHAYEYGKLGCPQDAALSIHYYTIAALGGDPQAMLAMCAWYMVGAEPVLPRNPEEAYEWAIRAAERGLAKAQFAVGYFMENGIGVDRDIAQSTFWYRKAADAGDEKAIERLKKHQRTTGQGAPGSKKSSDKDCIIC